MFKKDSLHKRNRWGLKKISGLFFKENRFKWLLQELVQQFNLNFVPLSGKRKVKKNWLS